MILTLHNNTAYSAEIVPGYDADHCMQYTVVVKAAWRFSLTGELTVLEKPMIALADGFRGDAQKSSLVVAEEGMPFKNGGEFYLYGSAQTNALPVSPIPVEVSWKLSHQATWRKVLWVFGARQWEKRYFSAVPSKAAKLPEVVPLQYELAYGGIDPESKKSYALNPVGAGFAERYHALPIVMPQIESFPLLQQILDRPAPAGFAPIPVTWQISTDEKAPQKPIYQRAPLDQRFPQTFQGGEQVTLKNLVKGALLNQAITLELPKSKPQLIFSQNNQTEMLRANCDTVVMDSDQQILQMIWRAAIKTDWEDEVYGEVQIS